MGAEPDEDAISNFVSFTSTSREQAISFLKANNLDSQKAINAYFEDPTGSAFQTTDYSNEGSLKPLGYDPQDDISRIPTTAPPLALHHESTCTTTHNQARSLLLQRPHQGTPVGLHYAWVIIDNTNLVPLDAIGAANNGPGLSLAEREEQELQQAVAMSLNQGIGKQETGVTTTEVPSQAQFGKATRDYYDEGAWAMTLFNETAQEVIFSPDPEDRKKVGDEPSFIRPTTDNLYLGGFLTILHEIPLAREALLLRNKLLFDYGHDPQWWNGQTINLPKIVTVNDCTEDNDWEDIIHESQRLMAFLDSTQRAFGSGDALTGLRQLHSYSSDSEEIVSRFLEAWHASAIRADPDNPLATIFMSHAYKKSPFEYADEVDEPVSKELFVFEPIVEQSHGQSLYDVLDTAIWSDRPGDPLDDVWLEHVGEVLVMKLDSFENAKSVDVKIPAVFYPDRYLISCQDVARDMRTKKLRVQESLMELENLIDHYTYTPGKTEASLARNV
ncbi:hypothetical protein N7470_003197 [Penicillium chermesinum]|nr:hypothetical protein N7470_003197 [Penicillium chermesinum]